MLQDFCWEGKRHAVTNAAGTKPARHAYPACEVSSGNHFMMMTLRDKIRQDWDRKEDKASSDG